MYRSYGGSRRPGRSHYIRNGAIVLVVLIIAGVVFANTAAGKALLGKLGIAKNGPAQTAQGPVPTKNPALVTTPIPSTAASVSTPQTPRQTNGTPSTAPNSQSTSDVANNVPPAATVEGSAQGQSTAGPKPTSAPQEATPSTSPLETAQRFLTGWDNGKYTDMYNLLSTDAQKKYSQDYFVKRYQGIADMATITSVDAKLAPDAQKAAQSNSPSLQIPFTVKMQTQLVGDLNQNNALTLVSEDGHWRVQWSPSLIFKELSGDEHIYMERLPAPRGTIYDRGGAPLAVNGEIPQIGVIPGQIKDEGKMLSALSKALGHSQTYIKNLYKGKPSSWFIPIQSLSQDQYDKLQKELGDVPGVVFQSEPGRIYPQGKILAQVLGYVGPITAEDLKKSEYKDYPSNAMIGRAGLEHWGEKYLRGRDGGKLEVLSADYQSVEDVIKQRDPMPGDNIYLNIDLKLQQAASKAYGNKLVGSVVAMDPNNGQILALVSHPSYDPNDFVRGMSQEEYDKLSKEHAFINRSANAAYPMASTFKPITMAAALTADLFEPTSRFYDPGYWDKLGIRRAEWDPDGFGWLNLNEGLTRSADVVFYELGLKLYQEKYDYLSKYARKWGLGESPNVDGLVNEPGQVPGPGVPYPGWGPGDNVNLAIGQGALLVSPLQVAMVYTAIANGGTLYRPQLINRIVEGGGSDKVVKQYKPEVIRKVPVSQADLQQIQNDLKNVTQSDIGTAHLAFEGFPIPVAGKTGTGQKDNQEPFAWFSAYAPAAKPQIALVVMAENAGEGSEVAAPISRKILAEYFDTTKQPTTQPNQ